MKFSQAPQGFRSFFISQKNKISHMKMFFLLLSTHEKIILTSEKNRFHYVSMHGKKKIQLRKTCSRKRGINSPWPFRASVVLTFF